MAAIETETTTRLVLLEKQLKRMYEAVKGKEHFWIRLVTESETGEEMSDSIVAYLQGPDGEEEEIAV